MNIEGSEQQNSDHKTPAADDHHHSYPKRKDKKGRNIHNLPPLFFRVNRLIFFCFEALSNDRSEIFDLLATLAVAEKYHLDGVYNHLTGNSFAASSTSAQTTLREDEEYSKHHNDQEVESSVSRAASFWSIGSSFFGGKRTSAGTSEIGSQKGGDRDSFHRRTRRASNDHLSIAFGASVVSYPSGCPTPTHSASVINDYINRTSAHAREQDDEDEEDVAGTNSLETTKRSSNDRSTYFEGIRRIDSTASVSALASTTNSVSNHPQRTPVSFSEHTNIGALKDRSESTSPALSTRAQSARLLRRASSSLTGSAAGFVTRVLSTNLPTKVTSVSAIDTISLLMGRNKKGKKDTTERSNTSGAPMEGEQHPMEGGHADTSHDRIVSVPKLSLASRFGLVDTQHLSSVATAAQKGSPLDSSPLNRNESTNIITDAQSSHNSTVNSMALSQYLSPTRVFQQPPLGGHSMGKEFGKSSDEDSDALETERAQQRTARRAAEGAPATTRAAMSLFGAPSPRGERELSANYSSTATTTLPTQRDCVQTIVASGPYLLQFDAISDGKQACESAVPHVGDILCFSVSDGRPITPQEALEEDFGVGSKVRSGSHERSPDPLTLFSASEFASPLRGEDCAMFANGMDGSPLVGVLPTDAAAHLVLPMFQPSSVRPNANANAHPFHKSDAAEGTLNVSTPSNTSQSYGHKSQADISEEQVAAYMAEEIPFLDGTLTGHSSKRLMRNSRSASRRKDQSAGRSLSPSINSGAVALGDISGTLVQSAEMLSNSHFSADSNANRSAGDHAVQGGHHDDHVSLNSSRSSGFADGEEDEEEDDDDDGSNYNLLGDRLTKGGLKLAKHQSIDDDLDFYNPNLEDGGAAEAEKVRERRRIESSRVSPVIPKLGLKGLGVSTASLGGASKGGDDDGPRSRSSSSQPHPITMNPLMNVSFGKLERSTRDDSVSGFKDEDTTEVPPVRSRGIVEHEIVGLTATSNPKLASTNKPVATVSPVPPLSMKQVSSFYQKAPPHLTYHTSGDGAADMSFSSSSSEGAADGATEESSSTTKQIDDQKQPTKTTDIEGKSTLGGDIGTVLRAGAVRADIDFDQIEGAKRRASPQQQSTSDVLPQQAPTSFLSVHQIRGEGSDELESPLTGRLPLATSRPSDSRGGTATTSPTTMRAPTALTIRGRGMPMMASSPDEDGGQTARPDLAPGTAPPSGAIVADHHNDPKPYQVQPDDGPMSPLAKPPPPTSVIASHYIRAPSPSSSVGGIAAATASTIVPPSLIATRSRSASMTSPNPFSPKSPSMVNDTQVISDFITLDAAIEAVRGIQLEHQGALKTELQRMEESYEQLLAQSRVDMITALERQVAAFSLEQRAHEAQLAAEVEGIVVAYEKSGALLQARYTAAREEYLALAYFTRWALRVTTRLAKRDGAAKEQTSAAAVHVSSESEEVRSLRAQVAQLQEQLAAAHMTKNTAASSSAPAAAHVLPTTDRTREGAHTLSTSGSRASLKEDQFSIGDIASLNSTTESASYNLNDPQSSPLCPPTAPARAALQTPPLAPTSFVTRKSSASWSRGQSAQLVPNLFIGAANARDPFHFPQSDPTARPTGSPCSLSEVLEREVTEALRKEQSTLAKAAIATTLLRRGVEEASRSGSRASSRVHSVSHTPLPSARAVPIMPIHGAESIQVVTKGPATTAAVLKDYATVTADPPQADGLTPLTSAALNTDQPSDDLQQAASFKKPRRGGKRTQRKKNQFDTSGANDE